MTLPLRTGAGIFAGFALLAAADAVAIELTVPWPDGGLALRLLHHLFDASETLGLGAFAASAAASVALLRGRWLTVVALAVGMAPILALATGSDLQRPLVVAGLPAVYLLGAVVARRGRLRLAALAAAGGALVADHVVLPDDYFALHAVGAWVVAVFVGAVLAPEAADAVTRLRRRPRVGLAALSVGLGLAVLGVAVPPSNAVRLELFRHDCAVAPWVLASTVWPDAHTHGPAAVPASFWLSERSGAPPVAATTPAFLPGGAVVVLITVDALRADAVDDASNDVLFPTLAELKRSGARFTRASAPGSQTAVSLATIFSGRYFSELYWSHARSPGFDYPAEDPTPRFPALLVEHGVRTASFASLSFLAGPLGVARGFDEDRVLVTGTDHGRADRMVDALLERLALPGSGGVFAYTHLMEPHAPYDRGRTDGSAWERYLSEIAVADRQIGRVLDFLVQHCEDRWVLIVSADHGEAFGEHGTTDHGNGGAGPVGYWTFDTANVQGTQVLDLSGNNLTGTSHGVVTSVTGVVNQALSFDGGSGYISYPSDSLTDLTNSVSLALWIKTQNNSRMETLISRYSAVGVESGYLLRDDAAGHLELRIGGNNGVGAAFTDTGKLINDGQWHHVAAVITLGQGVSFYIDGALSSTFSANVTAKATGSTLEIALNPWTPYGYWFTGSMDDVRIYSRVLQASEIATLANAATVGSSPALAATPLTINYGATTGGNNPVAQAVNISNIGGGSLNWTATSNASWLTLSPGATNNGSTVTGTGAQAISVTATMGNLTPGTYAATVVISAPLANPSSQTVNVTLTITSPPGTGSTQHYVSPAGSAAGNGTFNSPWDLQTALNQPAAVQPGDTIWLLNGTYGTGPTVFTSILNGSATQPITVRQYPGARATINGGFVINGSNTWFWGFEVTNRVIANRSSGTSGENPPANFQPGFFINAPGTKFINLVVHDTQQGFGFWQPATNGEIYGCLIYNNGWQGTDNGHGHGIYTQNLTGTKIIADNIMFQGFGFGIQAYGSPTAYVQNYQMSGNTIFNSGLLTGTHNSNLLVAGGGGPQNISVTNNYTYHTPADGSGLSVLDWAGDTQVTNLTATNNYWIGGQTSVEVYNWTGATFTNNTIYSQAAYELIAGNLNPSTYVWNNNTYYGSSLFSELNNQGTKFANWQAATGLDSNSTFTPGAPTGTWVFVRPNQFETGRANVTIYNWGLASTVAVDLSSVLPLNSHYVIQNAQNFYAAPVASGTYTGGTVSIPMTGLTVAAPQGIVPNSPGTVGPQFGVFVVLQQ